MPFFVTIATSVDDRERCFRLRREVFVDEQRVPIALEIEDDEDRYTHLLLCDEHNTAVGTARLAMLDDAAKAQRVAVVKAMRGKGAGAAVMHALHDEARRRGRTRVVLSAQVTAIPFYERLGYVASGPVYDDAGIPHRDMSVTLRG
jgi:predicted GNAT family N-acyltransferase